MPTNIETLKKIEYTSLTQFLEDINKNFSVVENSPLYKGIAGEEGNDGNQGQQGIRGIKFLFVDLVKFQTQFPGELTGASQIDINYINTKLLSFTNKTKLLVALGVTELIDKDVIIISNTIMLSYHINDNKVHNTGIAFNQQTNLLNNIQTQIENYVQYYVNHNQTINNLSNIFENYVTYAKNYADNNNVYLTTGLTQTSVYSPYIPGFNSNIGILLNNHKYYGYSDSQFPVANNGTIVFGSMKKYYNLLMTTLSTNSNQTLTSDYAPGVNNIPSVVVLQDTNKAGILIGNKDNPNLKRFANIYKNDIHEFVFKTDSGVNPSEYSELKLHKEYMKFAKLVQFGNDLEVSRDVKFFADIQNQFLRTGKFTNGADNTNSFNSEIIELGKDEPNNDTITKNISKFEEYKYYLKNVLITDINGRVSKDYSLEETILQPNDILNLNLINDTIDSPEKILSSYYYGYLARKINAVSNYCTNNYWRKNQFGTQEIPDLWLSNDLIVDKNVDLGGSQLIVDYLQNQTELNSDNLKINGSNINFDVFINRVLVTGNGGLLSNLYFIEESQFPVNELNPGEMLDYLGESPYGIITTKYYGHLARKINQVYTDLFGNYWTKTQFENNDIPNLHLSNDLFVNGNVIFKPNNNELFKVNKINNEIIIGNSTIGTTKINSSVITLSNYINRVLVTGNNGEILNDYYVEQQLHLPNDLPNNNLITDNIGVNDNFGIAKAKHIQFLGKKINQISQWITGNFWTKIQFNSGVIPSLWLNNTLRIDNKLIVGSDQTNPNILSENDDTYLGKSGGNTQIKGTNINIENSVENVIVTDSTGKILLNHSIEQGLPNSGPGTGGQLDTEIEADFWIKQPTTGPLSTVTPWQPFLAVPNLGTNFLTSIHFEHITKHLKAIRKLLFDRPTYSEAVALVDIGIPIGSVILWDNVLSSTIPIGYVVCDGRIIPGTTIPTRNYTNKFVKGSLTPSIISGNINHLYMMKDSDLFPHRHDMQHFHEYRDKYFNEKVNGQNNGWIGSADSDNDNTNANTLDYTTIRNTDGPSVNETGTFPNKVQTAMNIEPHSITAIYILRYWNGQGIPPVTNMPPFATITTISIQPNTLNVDLNLNFVDLTVNTFNVEGSLDGITWNTLKIVLTQVTTVTNILLPQNGDWQFRLKATNGNSSYTNGEYTLIFLKQVYTIWSQITWIDNLNLLPTVYFQVFDSTVTTMKIQASSDNGITWNNYFVGGVPIPNIKQITVPTYGQWQFRLLATNGNPILTTNTIDEYSNVEIFDVQPIPVITDIYYTEYQNSNGGGGIDTTFDFISNNSIFVTTIVKIEWKSGLSGSNWTTFEPAQSYSGYFQITKSNTFAANYNGLFRFKALNGPDIGLYSNEFQFSA